MDRSTEDEAEERARASEGEEWSQGFVGRLRRFFSASVKEVRISVTQECLNCDFRWGSEGTRASVNGKCPRCKSHDVEARLGLKP